MWTEQVSARYRRAMLQHANGGFRNLNSNSLPPQFGQGAGVPYRLQIRGKLMAKLLNELGRGKPAIPPSFTPCPLALADRDRREALRDQQSLTAAFFGDPLPGMSAFDRRERERVSLTRVGLVL